MFINRYIYAYRQNVTSSITASGGERSYDNLFEIIKTEVELIEKRSYTAEAKKALLSFLGYELCILISIVNTLPKTRREDARKDLKELSWLLEYKTNPKVRMVSTVHHVFGFNITETVLRCYEWYRSKKN